MTRKTKVTIEVKRLDDMEKIGDMSLITDKLERADETEKLSAPAMVISRANFPIIIAYGDEKIRLSPRQRVKVADVSKISIEDLPADVTVILK